MAVACEVQVLSPDINEQIKHFQTIYGQANANAINYVTKLFPAYLNTSRPNSELISSAEAQAIEDIYKSGIEERIAGLVGEDPYELEWRNVNGDTDLGMVIETKDGEVFYPLNQVYQNALQSAQIPGFEKDRNQANLNFYNKLKAQRTAGYLGPMVEFSPSPKLTEAAKQRGYEGRDTIFIFEHIDGKEYVNQVWFPGLNFVRYQELLQEIQNVSPEDERIQALNPDRLETDIDIMNISGRFSAAGFELIETFKQKYKILAMEGADQLKQFARTKIKTEIKNSVPGVLNRAALNLALGNNITEDLKTLAEIIGAAQMTLITKAKNIIDRVQGVIDTTDLTAESFANLSHAEKVAIMEERGFVAKGCGFNFSFNKAFNTILGRSSGLSEAVSNWLPDESEPCGSCGRTWKIKEGDVSTYKENCPHCGSSVRC